MRKVKKEEHVDSAKEFLLALDNIVLAIEQGVINKTTNKRMIDLETRLEELEKEILIEKSKADIRISENQIKEFYKQALKLDPETIINIFVKNVRMYNDRYEITLNSPIKSPDDKGFLFCTKFTKLRNYVFDKLLIVDENFKIEFYL